MLGERGDEMGHGHPSRREFLSAAGTAGAIGLSGLAGCITGPGSSGIGTVTWGALDPLTGPYGALAENGKKGADLAVEHVNEDDEFDFELEIIHEDSETDPATGQRKATKLVQQDGAEYLLGGTSSTVAIAINEFAKDNEVITNPVGVATQVTSQHCNPYVFRASSSVAQLAEPLAAYTVNNLGTNVWFHSADYSYGESIHDDMASRMAEVSDRFEEVGYTTSQLGETNFNSYITQIGNSDAEVAVLGLTGNDLINFVKRARGQGLTEHVDIVSPTITQLLIRQALGPDAVGTYGAMRYLPSVDTESNNRFVEDFRSAYGTVPDTFAGVNYLSVQMTVKGIAEAGTADPTEVKDVLPELPMEDTIVGPTYFRRCDHQAVNTTWVSRNAPPESGDVPALEVLRTVDGEEAIYPCGDAACTP